MTPKDKALDLCGDFYAIKSNEPDYGIEWEMAKQCALIVVDEIIEEVREYCDDNFHQDRLIYWQEVKQEIEKL